MKWLSIVAIITLCLTTSLAAFAQELYRYRDDAGIMRMEPTIPAQYVDKGYDVLSSQGILIRRVPARETLVTNDDTAQRAEDNSLLTSYSTVEEIAAHRDRRLLGVQRQIEIIMSDRRVITGELDKEIKSASAYRADGNPVPEEINSRIAELDVMVQSLDQQMLQRAEEKQQITEEFTARIERFQIIKPQ
jgi:hypothetical protein